MNKPSSFIVVGTGLLGGVVFGPLGAVDVEPLVENEAVQKRNWERNQEWGDEWTREHITKEKFIPHLSQWQLQNLYITGPYRGGKWALISSPVKW